MSDFENLKNDLTKHGQEHLLRFWDKLSDSEKLELREDLREFDMQEATSYFQRAFKTLSDAKQHLDDRMKPIPPEVFGSIFRSSQEELQLYQNEGFRLISEGKVGVLLLAGGQGTRLGVSYPKGMYDVGLPSHKSLFQIQAERIRHLEELAFASTQKRGHITWYIMTSEQTMEPTLDFFQSHNFFGLDSKNVKLFEQGMFPCFTMDGRIILSSPCHIAKAPDGNGGLYRALRDRGVLDDIESRGITCLHAHSVDNILVSVADPIFIGYCNLKQAECGAKVVAKAYPSEPLGVVCSVDGKYQVVEYNEISDQAAELRNEDGKLTFSAGSICNHFFSTEFLRRFSKHLEHSLQLHVAKKKIPYVDDSGVQCSPEKPNGIKIEKFIFDVFKFTDKLVVWEVPREKEFSALKNADSAEKDCPRTAKQDLINLHLSYVKNAGGKIMPSGDGSIVCEISPLLSYAGEGLSEIVHGRTFTSPIVLVSPNEKAYPTLNGISNRVSNGTSNGIH